jgi:hypothetical protein
MHGQGNVTVISDDVTREPLYPLLSRRCDSFRRAFSLVLKHYAAD